MRRALATIVASLLMLCAAASPAAAQDPGKSPEAHGPPETLPVLERRRNEAMRSYLDTNVELTRIGQTQAKLVEQLETARRQVEAAEAQAPGPLRTAAIQKARQDARAVSDQLARERMRKDELTTQQELILMRYIEAGSAYASRLLEVAHRNVVNGVRLEQAREQTEKAMAELELISKMRALEPPPPAAPSVPPLDEDASLDEMNWRADAYKRQLEAFADQLVSLRPKVERSELHVKRLNSLISRGYASSVPGLAKALEREQERLEDVLTLRRRIEKQGAFYKDALKKLQERIKQRIEDLKQKPK
ncbi:MAG: hypothetical protein AB7N76_22485 [Planctomycetota bacterium]